nr:DUF5916 domain-containing protein [uncultured Undibacterium sp.]
MLKKIVIALSLCFASVAAQAQIETQTQVQTQSKLTIPRAKSPPLLRHYVGGVPADAGFAINEFTQRSPSDGNPATQATTAYLSYDDTHFYAMFVAKDDPSLIRARVAKREDFEGDDFTVLELDTFHDKRRSFIFFVNPYGVQLDSRRTEGLDPDNNFDTQWESEGELTSDGYVTRLAIPLKSLRFKNTDVQTWGVAVGRVISRLNEESFWPPISKKIAGFVPQMASMTIPEKLSAGRNAQINPFVFLGNSRLLNTDDHSRPLWLQDNKVQAGLDAKWVLGDATAIDLTLKPDFSEVESDEPQIVVGKRYEVLFPEKRPFFLENASFFHTPNPLFFSRRISQPNAGLRVTGRAENWAYGGLLIDDQAAGEDQDLNKANAHIAMARVQNDVTHDLSLGVLATNRRVSGERTALAERDSVLSFDGRYQWDENWIFQSQFARSQSQTRIDNRDQQLSGHLNYIEAKHQGKHLELLTKYLDVSANFATSLAFLPRTDVKQIQQEAKYVWHLEGYEHLQRVGAVFNGEVARNQDGQLQDWSVNTGMFADFSRNSWFEMFARRGFENYAGRDYRKQGWMLDAGSSWWNWLSVMTQVGVMDSINYTPADGVSALMGKGRNVELTVTFKPHPQWRLEEKVLWNDLRTPSNSSGETSLVYRNLMLRSKLSYQYNRFLGLRLIADYHMLDSNQRLSTLTSGKQLNTDFQLSYLLSPGTSLIAGYGNRQENLALIGNPTYLQRTEDLNLRTGRRAFIKLNYLYQL